MRGIADKARTIRLPVHVSELLTKVYATQQRLTIEARLRRAVERRYFALIRIVSPRDPAATRPWLHAFQGWSMSAGA